MIIIIKLFVVLTILVQQIKSQASHQEKGNAVNSNQNEEQSQELDSYGHPKHQVCAISWYYWDYDLQMCKKCVDYCYNCIEEYDNCLECYGINRDPKNKCRCIEGSKIISSVCGYECDSNCQDCNVYQGHCRQCIFDSNRVPNPETYICECQDGYLENKVTKQCEKCFKHKDDCLIECPDHYREDYQQQICVEDYFSFTKKTASFYGDIVVMILIVIIILSCIVGVGAEVYKKWFKKNMGSYNNTTDDENQDSLRNGKKSKIQKKAIINSSSHHFIMNTKSQEYQEFHKQIEEKFNQQIGLQSKDEPLSKNDFVPTINKSILSQQDQSNFALSNTYIFQQNNQNKEIDLDSVQNLNDNDNNKLDINNTYNSNGKNNKEKEKKLLEKDDLKKKRKRKSKKLNSKKNSNKLSKKNSEQLQENEEKNQKTDQDGLNLQINTDRSQEGQKQTENQLQNHNNQDVNKNDNQTQIQENLNNNIKNYQNDQINSILQSLDNQKMMQKASDNIKNNDENVQENQNNNIDQNNISKEQQLSMQVAEDNIKENNIIEDQFQNQVNNENNIDINKEQQ